MKNLPIFASIAAILLGLAFLALFIAGWVMNIVAILHLSFDHVGGEHIIRIIGIFFAPIGAIAGWF